MNSVSFLGKKKCLCHLLSTSGTDPGFHDGFKFTKWGLICLFSINIPDYFLIFSDFS